jgi:hypothetical protein
MSTITASFVETLLKRVDSGHVKLRVEKGSCLAFRENGKTFAWFHKARSRVTFGGKEYAAEDAQSARAFHDMILGFLGRKIVV